MTMFRCRSGWKKKQPIWTRTGNAASYQLLCRKRGRIRRRPEHNAEIGAALAEGCAVIHPACMLRRQELERLGVRYEEAYTPAEDYALFMRLRGRTGFYNLQEVLLLYRNFPDLWRQLEEWDNSTWRTFLKNYSVRELAARFDFEDEWQAAGGNIRSRAFYSALRQELSRLGSEVTLCRTSKQKMLSKEQ